MDRIVSLDIAKAICIVLVVIGHYHPDPHPVWWGMIHDVIYSFHMPLFMFASGFVYIATKKQDESYRHFLWKKVKRLMIPYLVVSILIICLKIVTESHLYVENPKTFASFLKILYYPEAGYFLWFIWALWWMFVLVPLFKTKRLRLVLLLISVLLAYVPFDVTDVFCVRQFKQMFVYFMVGVVCYDWRMTVQPFAKVPALVYTFLFIVSSLHLFGIGGGNFTFISYLVPYIGIAMIVSVSKRLERYHNSCWMLLSSSSYIIYLFHTTFEGFAKAVISKIQYFNSVDSNTAFLAGAIIVVLSGVVVPVLLNEKVLRRFEITRFLFGLK